MNMKRRIARPLVSSFLLIMTVTVGATYAETESNPATSALAFVKAYEVFMHPRCMNCHPAGDRPLQGDDSHPHTMGVMRGPGGLGQNGLWCSTCHQDRNLAGAHLPPGGPGWQLPTADMPMVFEKRTPGQLCRQFKDPAQNGGRNLQEVLDHIRTAPLVLWGWQPGESRTAVSVSHDQFMGCMTEWVDKGAACPD